MWLDRITDFFRHLTRFAVGGSASAVVQSLCYLLLVRLGWTGPVLASVIAFALGTLVSFTVHYNWTFRSARSPARAAWRFGVARLVGLGVNTGGVDLLTGVLGLSDYWGLVCILVITPLAIFTISKYWVFRDSHHYRGAPRAG